MNVTYACTGMFLERAQSSDASSTAAAPSVSGELLPAVSVPAGLESKAVLRVESFSSEVSPRTLLSRCKSPNGITRSSKKRACHAAAAFLWLASASSSCSRRPICHSFAISSQCWPIDRPVRGSAMPGAAGARSPGRRLPMVESLSPHDLPRTRLSTVRCSLGL